MITIRRSFPRDRVLSLDERDRTAYCINYRMGQRPLHVFDRNSLFAFAGEASDLIKNPSAFQPTLDLKNLA